MDQCPTPGSCHRNCLHGDYGDQAHPKGLISGDLRRFERDAVDPEGLIVWDIVAETGLDKDVVARVVSSLLSYPRAYRPRPFEPGYVEEEE